MPGGENRNCRGKAHYPDLFSKLPPVCFVRATAVHEHFWSTWYKYFFSIVIRTPVACFHVGGRAGGAYGERERRVETGVWCMFEKGILFFLFSCSCIGACGPLPSLCRAGDVFVGGLDGGGAPVVPL